MAEKITTAQQESYVQQYLGSGMTQREFAKKIGVTFYAFQWWLKLSRRKKKKPMSKGFVEIKAIFGPPVLGDCLHIEVGQVKFVFARLPDAAWLAAFAAGIRGHQ